MLIKIKLLSPIHFYQRGFRDGGLDPQFGIYREPSDGPFEICMAQEGDWHDRVVDETVVYNSQVRIEET